MRPAWICFLSIKEILRSLFTSFWLLIQIYCSTSCNSDERSINICGFHTFLFICIWFSELRKNKILNCLSSLVFNPTTFTVFWIWHNHHHLFNIFQGIGHARNLSSLGMEGLTIQQRRGAKAAAFSWYVVKYFSFRFGSTWYHKYYLAVFICTSSEIHIQKNISCPVSPIGSPLLKSRSPQNMNGRMSPSPISSPRTTSGASTPLTGGNGAIPFNHQKHSSYLSDGFTTPSTRSPNDLYPGGSQYHDPELDLFLGVTQGSPLPQFGKLGHGNVWDSYDRQSFADNAPRQFVREHGRLNPSLDLRPGSPKRGI